MDTPALKGLKDLPQRLQSASLNERQSLFEELNKTFSAKENGAEAIPEPVIRGVCRLLAMTIPRFTNSKSRYLVDDFVRSLCVHHKEASVKHLSASLLDIASALKNSETSATSAWDILAALKWSVVLLLKGFQEAAACQGESFTQLVEAQAIFLSLIEKSRSAVVITNAHNKLTNAWKKMPGVENSYVAAVTSMEPSPASLVIGVFTLVYAAQLKNTEVVEKLKALLLDGLIKISITTKTRPPAYIFHAVMGLLKRLTHAEIKGKLLPAMSKAMLRSPEIILQAVGLIMQGLAVDLSAYAAELGKPLTTQLISKELTTREEAMFALGILASQCTEPAAVKSLLDIAFAVLNGSEGKITVAEIKSSVLQAIGNLSKHAVLGAAAHDLSVAAVHHLVKTLETEVHEATLIQALHVLSLWTAKLSGPLPPKLVDCFQKGPGLKTSTSAVRVGYWQSLSTALESTGRWEDGLPFVPALVKTVEKAATQPAQVPIVCDGVSASTLLLTLASAEPKADTQCAPVWPILTDMDKQLFVNDKFLTAAQEETWYHVALYVEKLLCEHGNRVANNAGPLYRALALGLTRPSYAVRARLAPIVKKMLASLGGINHAFGILKELTTFVATAKIQSAQKEKEEGSSAPAALNEIPAHALVHALTCATHIPNLNEQEATSIAVASFQLAYHPALVSIRPSLWKNILKRWQLEPDTVVEKSYEDFKQRYIEGYSPTPWLDSALCGVLDLNPIQAVQDVVTKAVSYVTLPELKSVSRDDYFVFMTPAGELYDRSVIENAKDDAGRNMKRESKAYSYKEQLEEIQLRRELEEKRKREGKYKEPELNPKQKEAVRVQLEKEAAVREKLRKLYDSVNYGCSLLANALKSAGIVVSFHMAKLLPALLPSLDSPISAQLVASVFLEMRHCVFDRDQTTLGEALARVTLRLLKPQCDLSPAWEGEPLDTAVKRILKLLVTVTAPSTNAEEVSEASEANRLTGPTMAYCFPLIKGAVKLVGYKQEGPLSQVITLLERHANLRGRDTQDLNHPRLLPLLEMIDLTIRIIDGSSGRVQQQACHALIQICSAASGKEGCAKATSEEVNCLLDALENPGVAVRDAALRGLSTLLPALPKEKNSPLTRRVIQRLWVAKFDPVEEIKTLAEEVFVATGLSVDQDMCSLFLHDVTHPQEPLRQAGAEALAEALKLHPKKVDEVLERMLELYEEKLQMLPPVLDAFGRVLEPAVDVWAPRSGVALGLRQLCPLLNAKCVGRLARFFVPEGLGDRQESVRQSMLNAALALVDIHGKETVGSLLPVLEKFMDEAPTSESYDAVRQAVVIIMGSLARHLDKEDRRIKPIVSKLVDALSTPSQPVQEAVANCLPPLVPAIKDSVADLVKKLINKLLESDNYGERKGAAYGLAGIVKGLGILALKQLEIMSSLTDAIQDKKNFRRREGALFAFEQLCNMLGRLFEPYIVHVLPHLLLCFGDSSQYVREAADDTAKAVMSKLSAHGVKLVLPSLLAALEEDSWRTKTGSVELLGAMAYCAPRQLSSCLPSIVPKLIEVLGDSHVKVQGAGAQALEMIGSVIRNPEIQAIVPVLLGALQNPAKQTAPCLGTLLETKFVHFIDAPSLALIMPVVQRAFQDRSTETRKMAAQIIGNMYSLTDQKDLSPYLPTIIPGLKACLLDPVPEVRAVSSRALGAMVRGMGEASFEDLLPWLMQTLTSEISSVDRSGAAQGLAEVVGGLGVEKLHKLMPEIIATAERNDLAPHVKDGYIMMFIYMPAVFQNEFTPYISQIIPPILKALADENEYVRDTALRAGQRIVHLYAERAILVLLPELEKGLLDDNWRIRYSSVQLLGDLLYKISGVSGKMTTETASEDDNFGTEQSHSAIMDTLGAERRNRVLAGLYMGRSDVALMVRQAALHVWKVVVTNTPRTLREILPTLFGLLLGCLASTSYDKRQVAARTLGDLVRKLGERVLPEIIPILERGLESPDADQRQGVCIGLSEIMASTSRDMVLTFVDSLVPTVRKALSDPLPEVRMAAARTFDSLHSTVGSRALDDILPPMLEQLNKPPHGEFVLDGLRQVMAIKSRVVLPYLIPQLTAQPVNTQALCSLAAVAGDALSRHLNRILPALLTAIASAAGTPQEHQELEYCQSVLLSVQDDAGVRTVLDDLLSAAKSDKPGVRRAAVVLLAALAAHTKADYSAYVPQLLRGLVHLLTDTDMAVLNPAWEALAAVIKTLDGPAQLAHVADLRQAVKFAASDLKGQPLLPGFCLPKGISPLLPVYREAILNGPPELKESAAQGLGEVIKLTSAEALKPSVVHITGPLIRILGDRFSAGVKVAVLETLALLLAKVQVLLKPFLPQLQTTFVKALNDPNRQVRLKAASALSQLIVIHARPDPLFAELHTGVKNADDSSIRETTLQALRGLITPAGDKMSETIRKSVVATLQSMLNHPEDTSRAAAAGCLGASIQWLPADELSPLIDSLLEDDPSLEWTLRHGRSAAITVGLKEAPAIVAHPSRTDKLQRVLQSYLQADRIPVVANGIRGIGYWFKYCVKESLPLPPLVQPLAKSLNHSSNEVKILVPQTSQFLARGMETALPDDMMKPLLPQLVNGTKEKNSAVKSSCEYALVSVLRLRQGDETQQHCLNLLDPGARESLSEVINKVLRKLALQPEGREEELDATLVS